MSSTSEANTSQPGDTILRVLLALSCAHFLNDILQAVIPALYPLLKLNYGLNFTQIGLITLTFQLTGSLFQPLVGRYTDRNPFPYSLPIGMTSTLIGLLLFSNATHFHTLIIAAAFTGTGSAVFHPEASRLARLASGGRHGFAQSLFQVGGNLGTSFGPPLAAWVVVPHGQHYLLWFTVLALVGISLLTRLGNWYRGHLDIVRSQPKPAVAAALPLPLNQTIRALVVLGVLIFSKYFYLASLTNYYTFYLISRFGLTIMQSEYCLFAFLFAVAAGTMIGGPVGDRIGRKYVIWVSILGIAPFTLALPYTGLVGTIILSVIIGTVLASAFSAILVYATELVPGKVGMIAGLFFGFAFGMAGIASALLGKLADHTSITFVYQVCSFLPLLGIVTMFLPDLRGVKIHGKA